MDYVSIGSKRFRQMGLFDTRLKSFKINWMKSRVYSRLCF